MTDINDALAIIGANISQEARDAHLQERRLNLAASGTALAVDLGVEGLPQEQREQTEAQLIAIATEIQRLGTLLSVPVDDYPQISSLLDQISALTDAVDLLILDSLGGFDV